MNSRSTHVPSLAQNDKSGPNKPMKKRPARNADLPLLPTFADRSVRATLRFLRRDRVLRGFRHAELYDRLRLDLNWFTSLRVASHAGLAMRLHEAAEAGHNEHTILLRFFNRRVCQVLQKRRDRFVVGFKLFGQVPGELSFGHTRSHEFLLRGLASLLVSSA